MAKSDVMPIKHAITEMRRMVVFFKAAARLGEACDAFERIESLASDEEKRAAKLSDECIARRNQLDELATALRETNDQLTNAKAALEGERQAVITEAQAWAENHIAEAKQAKADLEAQNKTAADKLAATRADITSAEAELDGLRRNMDALKSRAKAMIGG